MAGTSGIGFSVTMVAGGVLAVGLALAAYFTYQNVVTGDEVASLLATPLAQPEPENTPDPEVKIEAGQPVPPGFDVVRVEADGSSVIAGNAPPGADVSILLNGAKIGHAITDAQGNFVAMLDLPNSDNAQVLSLSMQQTGGVVVMSNDSVILAPVKIKEPDPEPNQAVVAEAVTTEPEDVEPAVIATASQPDADQTAPPSGDTQIIVAAPATPAVLLSSDQGVRVLQPAESGPSVMRNVVIDAISYDGSGQVQLSGRGLGDGFVRVYLDDTPILTTRINEGGGWHTQLPNVDTGIYTLRVDQVDATGTVISRSQTPFKREAASVLENAQNANPAQQITAITVQPGSTLWAIARDRYGDGMLYVRVFDANSDHIRDPDLIYPGQVFTVPN